jgi:hypothetical protein
VVALLSLSSSFFLAKEWVLFTIVHQRRYRNGITLQWQGLFCYISVAAEAGRGQKEDKGGIWLKERYQSENFKLYSA